MFTLKIDFSSTGRWRMVWKMNWRLIKRKPTQKVDAQWIFYVGNKKLVRMKRGESQLQLQIQTWIFTISYQLYMKYYTLNYSHSDKFVEIYKEKCFMVIKCYCLTGHVHFIQGTQTSNVTTIHYDDHETSWCWLPGETNYYKTCSDLTFPIRWRWFETQQELSSSSGRLLRSHLVTRALKR